MLDESPFSVVVTTFIQQDFDISFLMQAVVTPMAF